MSSSKITYLLFFSLISFTLFAQTPTTPPLSGTIFIDADIITSEDRSTFLSLTDAGQGIRTMYDRRANDWVERNAYLFNASYDDPFTLEIQVNPEFGSVEDARIEAEKYAISLGRLPYALKKDAETVWIHKGNNAFGGGNNNFLIHTGQGEEYINDGILEETFVHEGSHTSLDGRYANLQGWLDAQQADPTFISTYAEDFPNREDMAESFLPWFALRYARDRIDTDLANLIMETIPNRIAFFDGLDLNMYPFELPTSTKSLQKQPPSFSVFPTIWQNQLILNYDLPTTMTINIHLYDINGQLLERLVENQQQTPGKYNLKLERPNLASGIYILSLSTENGVISKKVEYVR